MLTDAHGRRINYVRLAVTDRCNLRCTYCMPEKMQFKERSALLSYEEITRLMGILTSEGISRIRITGGEPFLRKDLMQLLRTISPLAEISITTNGVLTAPFIPELKAAGITKVNLSLDTLQPQRFLQITRRDEFKAVAHTLETLLQYGMDVKINTVVMQNVNTDELTAFAALTCDYPLSVRFIEEMPFNGQGKGFSGITWHYQQILDTIAQVYPLHKITDAPNSTSLNYKITGHAGNIGVIPAYSRTFCGTCNRLRITPSGEVKTCLYGGNVLNVRDLMRDGMDDQFILEALQHAVLHKPADGFAAAREKQAKFAESMSVIGG